jgi:hypothetical protein
MTTGICPKDWDAIIQSLGAGFVPHLGLPEMKRFRFQKIPLRAIYAIANRYFLTGRAEMPKNELTKECFGLAFTLSAHPYPAKFISAH